jgi:hypothetical protein
MHNKNPLDKCLKVEQNSIAKIKNEEEEEEIGWKNSKLEPQGSCSKE